jgi:hypothetical protein
MEYRNQSPGSVRGIYVGRSCTEAGSSPKTSVYIANYDSTKAVFTHLSSGAGIMGPFAAIVPRDSALPQPKNKKGRFILPVQLKNVVRWIKAHTQSCKVSICLRYNQLFARNYDYTNIQLNFRTLNKIKPANNCRKHIWIWHTGLLSQKYISSVNCI